MFTNLSIRTRLGIAFCAVLLLMAACVLTGVWGLNDMFGSAQHAVSNDVQLAQRTARIDVLVLNERRHEKDIFINLADEAKKKDYKKNWDDDLEALKSEINAVHALELSDEDHRAIEDMRSQVEAYAAGLLGVFAKVQAAEIKSTQDANAAMSVHKEAIHALEATSEKVNAHAIAKVNGIVASLSTTRVTTRNVMLGLGAACLVLGVMLCLAIIRSITRPLRRAMEVAQAIAGGKLDNHIAANARDETGSLLKALGAMQDSLLHSKLNCEGQLESIDALQAVIEFTPHGVIEMANQNFLNTMGYIAGAAPRQAPQPVHGSGRARRRRLSGLLGTAAPGQSSSRAVPPRRPQRQRCLAAGHLQPDPGRGRSAIQSRQVCYRRYGRAPRRADERRV
jgi:HAMP domain-containing protein